MSDDERMLMLSPELLGSGGVPGSVVLTADCGHRAWISPDGLALKLAGGCITRCWDCVDPADVTEVEEMPGTRQTLRAMLGVDEADELLARAMQDPPGMVRALHGETRRRKQRRRR